MRADSSKLRAIAQRSGIPVCEAILESFSFLSRIKGQPWRTMLAVCPNSEAVLRSALLAAKSANAPVMFAATLNQVDLDGGYTKWTPRRFVELVRKSAQEIAAQRVGIAFRRIDSGKLFPKLAIRAFPQIDLHRKLEQHGRLRNLVQKFVDLALDHLARSE